MNTQQILKNTVSAKNQLKKDQYVSFLENKTDSTDKKLKIAFVGNSITRHGVAPHIGWMGDYGMAASCAEKDYVHILLNELNRRYGVVQACICNTSVWERGYKNGKEHHCLYQAVKDFAPDIMVMRFVENCQVADFEYETFKTAYREFLDYLKSDHTTVFLTSSFWIHPGDSAIEEIGDEKRYPYIYLGYLGEMDEMKAIGHFEHSGVANHPGDLGMQTIANRIMQKMEEMGC